MKIGITYDLEQDYRDLGFSEEEAAEFDSIETIDAIDSTLQCLGTDTDRIGNIRSLVGRLAAGEKWDLVFNIAEGVKGFGRESQVPALLEAYDIPYTFSDPAVLSLCLHKGITQRVVRSMGLPTANFAVVENASDLRRVNLEFPLFAKPVGEGTGKGITAHSKIETRAELNVVVKNLLAKFCQPVLVETFLPGREFTVGVVGTGVDAEAVGVMEVHLTPRAERDVYGFYNKKNWREACHYSNIDGALAKQCEKIAIAAYRGLGCRDAGRIDLRLNVEGVPCFLEINPLAGIRPGYSDFCLLNELAGLTYTDFLAAIVNSACNRYNIKWRSERDLENRLIA